MSSISALSGNYYQLSSLLSGNSGTAAAPAGTGSAPSLAQALNASSSRTGSSSYADAYLLNLSPQARAMMSGTSASSTNADSSFQLSSAQQKEIAGIIAKYKDAPFTQETFEAIQKDLQAAGLDTQTLSLKDKVNSFNPTMVLISALNGDYSGSQGDSTTQADAQTKSSNYLQNIVRQWKSVSSTVESSSG